MGLNHLSGKSPQLFVDTLDISALRKCVFQALQRLRRRKRGRNRSRSRSLTPEVESINVHDDATEAEKEEIDEEKSKFERKLSKNRVYY